MLDEGGIMNKVLRGEDVVVTQYGEPTLMIVPYDVRCPILVGWINFYVSVI